VPEVLDRSLVEDAKNGMMFLPLESEKLKKIYSRKMVYFIELLLLNVTAVVISLIKRFELEKPHIITVR